jgi:hypothetical protein
MEDVFCMKTNFRSIVITAPIGTPLAGNGREDSRSRGVHDDLRANLAYVESGEQRHLFIGLDLLGLKRNEADEIKLRVQMSCGLAPEQITIFATHTHSGPNTLEIFRSFLTQEDLENCCNYCAWLVDRISAAVPELVASAAESKLAIGSDVVEGYSFNRRVILNDGTLKMVFEDYDRAQIARLSGPNGNPAMHVFAFADLQDRVKGVLINYTSHPAIVCGEDWLYTRDYVHALTLALQRRYGPELVVLYANGAQGNQVASDPYGPFVTGFAEADRVGKGLAEGAIRIIDRLLLRRAFQREAELLAATAHLNLPIRRISPEEQARARAVVRDAANGTGAQLHGLDPRVEAQSILEMAQQEQAIDETLIQAIRLGSALILTFPGEVFLEHAQDALRGLPVESAMVFGLANDYVGYIPTREAFSEGGYEVKTSFVSSRFDPSAGERLVSASRALAAELLAR